MIAERDTIKCEAVFIDDHTHRFLWKRVWNKDKPLATVIALNPSQADNIITDITTYLTINNIAKLDSIGNTNTSTPIACRSFAARGGKEAQDR